MKLTKGLACLAAASLLAGVPATAAPAAPGPAAEQAAKKRKKKKAKKKRSPLRKIYVVGNNWDGTADIVDARTFDSLERFNVVPDRQERMAEISTDPVRLGFFLGIRELVGEGHDQLVDDAFTSHDGRFVYISRPSFADVVAISLKTKEIVWRTPVEGQRSDHMAISPDGTRLLVSASTARKVHVIDTATGEIVGNFESGDTPHESNYSADGKRIYHASIGMVYSPLDAPQFDSTKGDRWFEIVDGETFQVKERFDIGSILRTFGYPGMSSAVRPMAVAPDERFVYFQLSFFHGFVEFDLVNKRPVRFAHLPIAEHTQRMDRTQYVLDSAHHGLVLSGDARKLCVAGTMSDYAAIVDRETFTPTIATQGLKPYWATNSHDGKHCIVSFSGENRLALIDYETGEEVDSVDVGYHPQRVREGVIRRAFIKRR